MNPSFVFSTQHLIVLIFVAIFLFSLPKLTKNLLPYSYLIEKIICISFIFEIILEQICLISLRSYDVLSTLPIGITRITTYICIAILLFKKSAALAISSSGFSPTSRSMVKKPL